MLQKPFTGAGTLLYVSNVVLIFFQSVPTSQGSIVLIIFLLKLSLYAVSNFAFKCKNIPEQ